MANAGSPPAAPTLTKTFKYGMPIYGLCWPEGSTFLICGGGGETSSGIKNRVVFAEAHNGGLTDQIAEHSFGKDCPTRLALSPGGKHAVVAMAKGGIKRLDLDWRGKVPKVTEASGSLQERLSEIQLDVKALAFSADGSWLAVGGEDGSLLVLEWPSLKARMTLSGDKKLPEAVKDLDFLDTRAASAEGASASGAAPAASASASAPCAAGLGDLVALAVVLDNGSCLLYDVGPKAKGGRLLCRVELAKGEFKSDKVMTITSPDRLVLQHLPKGMENAQFSRVCGRGSCPGRLTFLMNNRSGAHVAEWAVAEDGLMALQSRVQGSDGPAACMDVDPSGGMVALGTSEGDVVLITSRPRPRVVRRYPKAHMVFTTCIAFSADGRHVLSASADASACLNSTAQAARPKTDFRRIGMLALFIFLILATILLQVVRVLKSRGMTTQEILALVSLGSKRDAGAEL